MLDCQAAGSDNTGFRFPTFRSWIPVLYKPVAWIAHCWCLHACGTDYRRISLLAKGRGRFYYDDMKPSGGTTFSLSFVRSIQIDVRLVNGRELTTSEIWRGSRRQSSLEYGIQVGVIQVRV